MLLCVFGRVLFDYWAFMQNFILKKSYSEMIDDCKCYYYTVHLVFIVFKQLVELFQLLRNWWSNTAVLRFTSSLLEKCSPILGSFVWSPRNYFCSLHYSCLRHLISTLEEEESRRSLIYAVFHTSLPRIQSRNHLLGICQHHKENLTCRSIDCNPTNITLL